MQNIFNMSFSINKDVNQHVCTKIFMLILRFQAQI